MTVLKDLKARTSRSAQVKSQLDFPVIDTDIHTNEFSPLLEDYIAQYGGTKIVDLFREHLSKNGLNAFAAEWYRATPQERQNKRLFRPPFWASPAQNTYDLATVSLPGLLSERLEELGTDYAVLYPNISLFPINSSNDDLRRSLTRAINHYHADIYRPYADRLTPVAAIPLNTPEEGIEELEHAKNLGLKTALIPGAVRRPVKAIAEKYPDDAELRRYAYWLDFFGIDSEYDYDPFWQKSIELGINLSTHSGSQSWVARNSPSNYMFNHINHFADASEALAKALFFGGVTHRFPQLRIALLEAGAAWGANVLTHLVDRFEKRGNAHVQQYNPANVDRDLFIQLYREYGQELFRGREFSDEEILEHSFGIILPQHYRQQNPQEINDFALSNVQSKEDIFNQWVPNFYFGNEADDRTIVGALHPQATPFKQKVNALYSSDSGHWDVPELTEPLAETWDLVQEGAITAEDFKALVFTNPYNFYTANNPDFFKGTQVEAKLNKQNAA
ncbi:amidohydrolase family protein [Acinetobacter variabilis]|uniref:amidohydrolase family protein n=1 Tax=Acinetobacter variabilis TaxID=70346 RepID=UPI003D769CF2